MIKVQELRIIKGINKVHEKKKLFICYDYFSPAYKAGGPIRSLHNLTALLSDTYDMYVYTSNVDLDGVELNVKANSWLIFSNNIQVFYASKDKRTIQTILSLLREIKPDSIYINGLFTLSTVLFSLLAYKFFSKNHTSRLILAPRGMLQKGALSLKARKKKIYLRLFKLFNFHKQLVWHATDLQEVKDIQLFCSSSAEIHYVPNVPVYPISKRYSKSFTKGVLHLCSISLIAATKNYVFFLNCLKELPSDVVVEYDIYGPVKDYDYYHAIQETMKDLPSNIKVNLKGPVKPDEVPAILHNYNYFVLPTLGENFGHAIFEALGAGLPVIISDRTPWNDLQKEGIGWDLPLVEDEWIAVMQAVSCIKEDMYKIMAENAIRFALNYLKNSSYKEKYLQLFD